MKLTLQLRKPILPLRLSTLFATLIFTFAAVLAQAQDYTSIVVFGDSLSDTGNVAHLDLARVSRQRYSDIVRRGQDLIRTGKHHGLDGLSRVVGGIEQAIRS